MELGGGGGKGSLAVHLGFIEYNARVEPQLAFQDLPLQTTPPIREPPTTDTTKPCLADCSGRYGYYGIHWLMAFLRAFRQLSFFGYVFPPFEPEACGVNGLPERLRE